MSTATDLANQLKDKIEQFETKLKSGKVSGSIIDSLKESKDGLQAALNSILAKNGLISQGDVDVANEALRKAHEDDLKAEQQKYKKKFLIKAAIGFILIAGLVIFVNYKKEK